MRSCAVPVGRVDSRPILSPTGCRARTASRPSFLR